jgi:hypothetical protein
VESGVLSFAVSNEKREGDSLSGKSDVFPYNLCELKEPKHIQFVFIGNSDSGKTKRWHVATKDDSEDLIGEIRWFGPWECYVLYPFGRTVFEKQCLRDIADFCEEQTKQNRLLTQHKKASRGMTTGQP